MRCCAGPALTSCAAPPPDTRGREDPDGRADEGEGAPDGERAGRGAGRPRDDGAASALPHAHGVGLRAPARRRGGRRRGKADKRAARPESANEKARDRWVSAGSGPALIVRGGGLEPP